jgi:hypothetical protein
MMITRTVGTTGMGWSATLHPLGHSAGLFHRPTILPVFLRRCYHGSDDARVWGAESGPPARCGRPRQARHPEEHSAAGPRQGRRDQRERRPAGGSLDGVPGCARVRSVPVGARRAWQGRTGRHAREGCRGGHQRGHLSSTRKRARHGKAKGTHHDERCSRSLRWASTSSASRPGGGGAAGGLDARAGGRGPHRSDQAGPGLPRLPQGVQPTHQLRRPSAAGPARPGASRVLAGRGAAGSGRHTRRRRA